MLLLLLPLCLGLVSGGRLSECLLPGQTSDVASPSVPIPDAESSVSAVPEIVPAFPGPLDPAAGPVNPLLLGVPSQVPLLPAPVSSVIGFLPASAPAPAPAPAPVPAEESGRRASFVNVGSFSSVGSFQGPQSAAFFQFASPSPGLQVGYSGAHLSAPVVVCLSWCLDPTGNYFCCRYTGGRCPVVSDVCPANSQPTRLPSCSGDRSCSFGSKCCFDRCQEQFVCKTSVL